MGIENSPMSATDRLAHAAASYVRPVPSPSTIAARLDESTGLSATGRGALVRLESALGVAS